MLRLFSLVILAAVAGGCTMALSPASRTPLDAPLHVTAGNEVVVSGDCAGCTAAVLDETIRVRSSERVAELKSRGGECAAYATVLEKSLLDARVTVRPYMWRVGGRLVSGEARSDGSIVVARDIDPLNTGVRTIEDMIRTLEHESVHVAFRISNGWDTMDDLANSLVRTCRQ